MAVQLDPLAGADGGAKSSRIAKYWLDQINIIKDTPEVRNWINRGQKIEKRYRDERKHSEEGGHVRRYSSLWSNVEILKPALYGKSPIPIAERRFKDKDPVGRAAADILERALRNEIEICGYDQALQQAVSDYLLPGRGTVWVRYEPEIEEGVSLPVETETDMEDSQGTITNATTDDQEPTILNGELTAPENAGPAPEGQEGSEAPKELEIEKLEATGDRVVRESTPIDYVPWTDFLTFPVRARVWAEVTAVGKRVYMSRDQAKKRFTNKIGGALPLKRDDRGQKTQNTEAKPHDEDKVIVFEIWSLTEKEIYWVCEGYDFLCDRKDDPLNLEKFFPCPAPLYANATNTTLVPVPDYIQYEDQATQIDEITQRIAMLTKGMKWAGLYNASAKDIQRLFNESFENDLLPVDDWAAFLEKGGVEGNISLLPVKDYIGILNELMMIKAKQVEEMDRLTGITDIMRGTTDARETLGGQRLKSNSSGTRLTSRQNEVARFARDTIRIMADIMSQHFSPKSLIEASGALYEEGLGPDDMPPLSELTAPPQAPSSGPPGAPGTPAMGHPPQAPPQMPAQAPGAPPMPPPQGGLPPQPTPPAAPTGSNVVPFRPPQPPMAMGPTGMPSPGMSPALPPHIPPEIKAKMDALKRIMAAIQLLRNEKLRGFRVDIEVDSTIFPDAAQEKQDRTVFIKEVTAFLQNSMAMGAQMPESIPLLGKMLQFGVRGYRVGRDLEAAIDEFTDTAIVVAKQKAEQAKTQPNPEHEKLMSEAEKNRAQGQALLMGAKTDAMQTQTAIQGEQIKNQTEQQKSAAEVERQRVENEGEQANSQADLQSKQLDLVMRRMEVQMEEMRAQIEMLKMQHEAKQSEVETEQAKFEAKEAQKREKIKTKQQAEPKAS